MFTRTLVAGWGDMDFNGHMRNTAYLDKAADIRMLCFAEHGFPLETFHRLRLGPVVSRDELEYHREVGLLQPVEVGLEVDGLSADGSRFRLRNTFRDAEGRLCARLTSTGGWLDLTRRRLVAPPAELLAVLCALPRTETFEDLPSSLKAEAP